MGLQLLQTILASGMIVNLLVFLPSGNMVFRNQCLLLYSVQLVRKELGSGQATGENILNLQNIRLGQVRSRFYGCEVYCNKQGLLMSFLGSDISLESHKVQCW